MYDNLELKTRIEKTRQKMYQAYEVDPNDPRVLSISQRLDELLNKYDRVLNKQK